MIFTEIPACDYPQDTARQGAQKEGPPARALPPRHAGPSHRERGTARAPGVLAPHTTAPAAETYPAARPCQRAPPGRQAAARPVGRRSSTSL